MGLEREVGRGRYPTGNWSFLDLFVTDDFWVVATQIFFIFIPVWGRFPFWLICFKGVETCWFHQLDFVVSTALPFSILYCLHLIACMCLPKKGFFVSPQRFTLENLLVCWLVEFCRVCWFAVHIKTARSLFPLMNYVYCWYWYDWYHALTVDQSLLLCLLNLLIPCLSGNAHAHHLCIYTYYKHANPTQFLATN